MSETEFNERATLIPCPRCSAPKMPDKECRACELTGNTGRHFPDCDGPGCDCAARIAQIAELGVERAKRTHPREEESNED